MLVGTGYFHGFITAEDSEILLQKRQVDTLSLPPTLSFSTISHQFSVQECPHLQPRAFLVRFSSTVDGAIVLDYVMENSEYSDMPVMFPVKLLHFGTFLNVEPKLAFVPPYEFLSDLFSRTS